MKIVNGFKPLTIFAKKAIINVRLGFKFTLVTLSSPDPHKGFSMEEKMGSKKIQFIFQFLTALRKTCPYSDLFWSVFSRSWTEYFLRSGAL